MIDPVAPNSDEVSAAADWWDIHLAGDAWPFSFQLDGQRVDNPARGWQVARASRAMDDRREELIIAARYPDHGLALRCVAMRYRDFPVVEWTVHLDQHEGAAPSVEELLGLDARWQHAEGNAFVVRGHKGDTHEQRDLYAPWQRRLSAGMDWSSGQPAPRGLSLAPTWGSGLVATGEGLAAGAEAREKPEGRPSSGAFPFFAVEEVDAGACGDAPPRRGLLLAVGWPGRWRAEFACEVQRRLRVRAGQEHTRFRLRPGESVRTPLIALLFFEGGDRVRAQNLWRRWMIAHNLPRLGGFVLVQRVDRQEIDGIDAADADVLKPHELLGGRDVEALGAPPPEGALPRYRATTGSRTDRQSSALWTLPLRSNARSTSPN